MTAERRTGRPTTYTDEIAAFICAELSNGKPLTHICKPDDMPGLSTVYQWLIKNSTFADTYTRARQDQADTLADEIVEIADTTDDPRKAHLQIEARKWTAAKLKPKKYGDIKQVDVTGGIDMTISPASKPVGAGTSQVGHKNPAQITDKPKAITGDKPG